MESVLRVRLYRLLHFNKILHILDLFIKGKSDLHLKGVLEI